MKVNPWLGQIVHLQSTILDSKHSLTKSWWKANISNFQYSKGNFILAYKLHWLPKDGGKGNCNVVQLLPNRTSETFKNWMLILVLLCENERQRWDASRYIKALVTRLISYVHFHITGPKLTLKTYNYRHCDTSMSQKNADYFPSGGVIATLLGNCKVLCYTNMNVTLFQVSANQISVFSITQQSR